MKKQMIKNYAALLAMAAMVPAAACGKTGSEAKSAETATAETATAEIATTETEGVTILHVYSTDGLRLDCTLGFEQLKADAIAMESMVMATETDDQIAYMTPEGVSFTMTKESHYAHPMILRRDVIISTAEQVESGEEPVSIKMAACGYGTKEASDRVMEVFANLNERFILQQKVTVVNTE